MGNSTESLSHHREIQRGLGSSLLSAVIGFVSNFPTVICAPIYSVHQDLATQVPVGVDEGLKHESSIHCDELMSLPKSALTNYVGSLSDQKLMEVNQALHFAVGLTESLE